MTPFEVVYGRPPPRVLTYVPGTSKVQAVEEFLIDRDKLLRDLRSNLLVARHRMKSKADSKRREVEFSVGDMLPPEALIHNVFHVSLLKESKGDPPIPVSSEASPAVQPPTGPQPEAVLEERVVKNSKYRPKTEVRRFGSDEGEHGGKTMMVHAEERTCESQSHGFKDGASAPKAVSFVQGNVNKWEAYMQFTVFNFFT
ncbi:hypothetical protein Tco_1010415 [Tanacetum coccineum]